MSTPPRAPRRGGSVAAVLAVVAASAGVLAASPAHAGGLAASRPGAGSSVAHYAVNRSLCSTPTDPAQYRCFAVARESVPAGTPGAYRVAAVGHGRAGGYSPTDLARAYGYDPNAAVSQTVAIVDWYDDPNIAADLAAFDRAYGLPSETSRSFRKVNQDGRPAPLPQRNPESATEIALDVQVVRAVCHKCRILLVEADGPTARDLARAENTAARLGATEISNSFGGLESGADPSMVNAFRHPGIVITASTGDDGWLGWDYSNDGEWIDREPSFPAADPYVVAVGGTTLHVNPDGTRQSETVWNNNGVDNTVGVTRGAMGATGGGCSRRFLAGSWQWHVQAYAESRCGSTHQGRVAADLAAVADPRTGFDVRDTYGRGGWLTVGGTSLSAPLVAAMYALAGGSGGSAYPAASLYVNSTLRPGARFDVTQGGNGYCGGETDLQRCMDAVAALPSATNNNPNGIFPGSPLDCSFGWSGLTVGTPPAPARLCNALPGYDGPTGLGTPIGLALFRPTSGFGALVSPVTPRLHRGQTWRAQVHERLAGAQFTSYRWSWGDGSASTSTTSPATAHTFTRPGRYVVSVAANDSAHQVIVRTRVVRVGVAPAVRYSGPKQLTPGRRGSFSAAGSRAVNTGTNVRSVEWHWGDGHHTGPSTSRHATHAFAHPGTYRVALTVRDSSGVAHTVRHKVTVR